MMKNILVTNDDGITADGILRLAKVATKLGKVYVIAPDAQHSAMSHKISLHESVEVYRTDFPVEGVEAYATTGTPADCVRFGMLNIVKGKTDLVLSGINIGFNCGTDLQYSATAGAALEAACSGVHAIALSEGFEGIHEVTNAYLEDIIRKLMDKKLGFNQIWNVNFPGCTLKECKGILEDRRVAHNSFFRDSYLEEALPNGRRKLTVHGEYLGQAEEGTDLRAILDGYISIGVVNNIS